MPAPWKVLLVDDQDIFVRSVETLLEDSPDVHIVGHAWNGEVALELVAQLAPDVVLMDIDMPVMDGVEATRRIREARPHACVLMLTGSNAASDVDRSRDAGAAGYVTKDRIASELVDAIVEAAGR